MTTPSAALLEGVRILDMATVLAAPFAATLCADGLNQSFIDHIILPYFYFFP